MRLTARRLNLATLARQLLLGREPLEVAEAVRRVVALQAQEAASPYLALWNRLAPFDPADLDAAFAGHAVIKATLMRITLHAVTAADYPRSTAATRTGGKNCRAPRSACCQAELQRSWPAVLRSSNSNWSTGGTRGRSA